MVMLIYPTSSPYYNTNIVNNNFLDVMTDRLIPRNPTDIYWIITQTYNLRPDMLAFDTYGDPKLWWVFAQRNPNTLKDPMFDFVTGVGIYLPTSNTLIQALGV
jgi:hypothetical protein